MNKILLASAFSSALILSACSSSDDPAQIIADLEATVSGIITSINDVGESDVAIEAVFTDPGGLLNPKTTSDTGGNFSLQVLKGDDFYLQATKNGFATINSARTTIIADETGLEFGIPTLLEAKTVIDTAFAPAVIVLADKAWLVVDVADVNGDEVTGISISSVPGPIDAVYTLCDGTDSGVNVTAGALPCNPDRPASMYIAYYDATMEVSVTVGSETQTAPVRMGEITELEFVQ